MNYGLLPTDDWYVVVLLVQFSNYFLGGFAQIGRFGEFTIVIDYKIHRKIRKLAIDILF